LTTSSGRNIVGLKNFIFWPLPMNDNASITLQKLENKLDQLLQLCEGLSLENRSLKTREADLLLERTRLMEKNEIARSRVEAMIHRLKSLEEEA
jgi:cell division protein ZapB